MKEFHRVVAWFGGMILVVAAIPSAVPAQGSSAATAQPLAHVRFWKTELPELTSVRVVFKPVGGKHPAAHEVGNGKPGYVFNNYGDAPVGRGTVEVFSGSEDHALASLPLDLAPGAFVTVLLSEPETTGGPPRLEIIEDGNTADVMHVQITVRNFVADLKDLHLTVGESLNVQFISGDSFLQMRGLKPALYPLRTAGTDLDGKSFDWNIDADFRVFRHQTLLIYPDSYGRIRPHLIEDAASQTDLPENKAGQR